MSMTRDVLHPRDEIMQTMDRIYRYRMTTTSGGNLSIRDDAGDICYGAINFRGDPGRRVCPDLELAGMKAAGTAVGR